MEMDWERLFRYDAWANDVALSSIRDQGDAGEEALKLFSHVLAAQLVWLSRLRKEPLAVQVWPSMTMTQIARYTNELPEKWYSFLGERAEGLKEACSYRNMSGERFETPMSEILMHVIVHSAYHRGQIAVALRSHGLIPAVTDYIAFARL